MCDDPRIAFYEDARMERNKHEVKGSVEGGALRQFANEGRGLSNGRRTQRVVAAQSGRKLVEQVQWVAVVDD